MGFIQDTLSKIRTSSSKIVNKTTDRYEDPVATNWKRKVNSSNKYFEDWERKFKCKLLEDYAEGFQWRQNDNYEPYTMNMFYSTIEVKRPSLVFNRPTFHIKPKPNKSDFQPEVAFQKATLLEDTLNTFIGDCTLNFVPELDLSLNDSWAYFSIVEVGYDADWISNPNAGKPILKSEYSDEYMELNGEVIKEPEELPEREWIYVKRIPAHRFRVGGFDSPFTSRNNWVGYYEFVHLEDLLATKGYIKDPFDDAGRIGVSRSEEYVYNSDEKQMSSQGDLVKIWKIWDLRAKERLILRDSPARIVFEPVPFKRLPLFDLRFSKRRKGWFPIPASFNWKNPQDEINEAREANRAHRRKARALFQAKEQSIDEDEIDKMLTAPDSTVILTKIDGAIKPVAFAPSDPALATSLNVTKDDFVIASGTTSEQQGQADRVTATATVAQNQRAGVREQSAQSKVAEWYCDIGKEVLLQVIEKFTLPFWIKTNLDVPQDQQEAAQITETFKLIEAEDLEDLDFEVDVSIESLSPVTNQQEKQKLYELLAILSQYPLLGITPDLVIEVAYRIGYRNQKVIQQLVKYAQVMAMRQGMMDTGGQPSAGGLPNGAPGAGQAANNMVQNQTPPNQADVLNQISGQVQ